MQYGKTMPPGAVMGVAEANYKLLERISVGGMAEVFKAWKVGTHGIEKQVAVKLILPHIAEDSEFISMFINEAKLAVQLSHANIAQIYDLGRMGDSYFISMEYVHGRDLRAIMCRLADNDSIMPISGACHIMTQVCEGLEYAHNKKDASGRALSIVHRDVSPQNVLVSYNGEIKLIDFGIAKAANISSKSQAGILKGKFAYMSPEQVRGLPVDNRSDIFSAGIILYELVTGTRLFYAENQPAMIELVRNARITPPRSVNRNVPPGLEKIILTALAKDPDDRFEHAHEMAEAIYLFMSRNAMLFTRRELGSLMQALFQDGKIDETDSQNAPPEGAGMICGPSDAQASVQGEPPPAIADEALEQAIEEGVREAGEAAYPEPAGDLIPMAPSSKPAASEPGKYIIEAPEDDPGPPAYEGHWKYFRNIIDKSALSGHGRLLLIILCIVLSFAAAHFILMGFSDPESATLFLTVQPRDSEVAMDGRALPRNLQFLVVVAKPGKHELTVRRDGYLPVTSAYLAVSGMESRKIISLEEKNKIYGSLLIDTVPQGAVVSVNGRVLAQATPVKIEKLLAEVDHPIVLEKKGVGSIEAVVRVARNEDRSFKAAFDGFVPERIEEPAQVPDDPPSDAPTAGNETDSPANPGVNVSNNQQLQKKRLTVPISDGFLSANSIPWSRVIVDGRDTGRDTPLVNFPLKPGRHRLTLKTGDGRERSLSFTIKAEQTTKITERY
jgi:serine/threonine protein kinase